MVALLVFALCAGLTGAFLFSVEKLPNYSDVTQGYHTESKLVEASLAGRTILFPPRVSEALVRFITAETLAQESDVAVFGSSHVLQLSSRFVVERTLQNFAVSGASLSEHLITSKILTDRQLRPRIWFIAIDPWIFDRSTDFLMWRARVSVLTAAEAELQQHFGGPDGALYRARATRYMPVGKRPGFSLDPLVTYFDRSAEGIFSAVVDVDAADGVGTVLNPDGAIVSSSSRPQRSVDDVRVLAARQFSVNRDRHRYGTFASVDPELWHLFTSWITYLQSDGAQVMFFLPPYHPEIYPRIVSEPQNQLKEVSQRVRAFASTRSIQVLGDYDPAAAGAAAEDFYDGDHLTGPALFRMISPALNQAIEALPPESKP